MDAGLKQRARMVQRYDWEFGRRLARNLDPPRQIGVWDVLLPFLFIFSLVNGQRSRELISANFLFTKKHAFEAAKRMLSADSSLESALEPVRRNMDDLLSKVPPEIYSRDIADRQLDEIRFLAGHYHELMAAPGEDYSALVRRTFPDIESFGRFHEDLRGLERQVENAARQTVAQADKDAFLQRLDEMLLLLRSKERKRIFSDPDR